MNRYYIAVTERHNDKYYSYWIGATNSDNVLSKLNNPKIIHANIYSNRKQAAEICTLWNESYKTNGTYLL